jgi:hypothetical protein
MSKVKPAFIKNRSFLTRKYFGVLIGSPIDAKATLGTINIDQPLKGDGLKRHGLSPFNFLST